MEDCVLGCHVEHHAPDPDPVDALLTTCVLHEPFTLGGDVWRDAIGAARAAGYIGVQAKGQITVTALGYARFRARTGEDRIAQLIAALNVPCPVCEVRAHFPCEPEDGGTHEARVRAGAAVWTEQELHIISTVFAQHVALIEGPPVNGDERTVALCRHVQRKAIQLAFVETCKP